MDRLRAYVVADDFVGPLKTIECSIMDIADDIAYSTYDLEDALKAGFISILEIISADDEFKKEICRKVKVRLDKFYRDKSESERTFSIDELNTSILDIFDKVFELDERTLARLEKGVGPDELSALVAGPAFSTSAEIAKNGYLRNDLTSSLVGSFVRGIEVIPNDRPQLSRG